MVELCPGHGFSPFCGDSIRGLEIQVKKGLLMAIFGLSDSDFCHLTANISKTISRSVTYQLGLNISSSRTF